MKCQSITTIEGCSGNAAVFSGTIGWISRDALGDYAQRPLGGVQASTVNVGCAAVEE